MQTLVRQEQEGRHERRLDTSRLPSGTYFLRLQAGDTTKPQKLTVVREPNRYANPTGTRTQPGRTQKRDHLRRPVSCLEAGRFFVVPSSHAQRSRHQEIFEQEIMSASLREPPSSPHHELRPAKPTSHPKKEE